MSVPAITVIVLWVIGLIGVLCKEGEPRGDHSFNESLAAVLIMGILLYWGGFFQCV